MVTKMYEKIKQFMKENWKSFVLFIGLYLLLTFPLPYYIYAGGGTIDIQKRLQVENGYQAKGNFSFAYVKELRGNVSSFLLAKVMSGWEIEKEDSQKLKTEETKDDVAFRNHIYLESANQTAIRFAYQKAGKEVVIKNRHFYVLYIDDFKTTSLKVGDEILEVEGQPLTNLQTYTQFVEESVVGDQLSLKVLRNGQEKKAEVTIRQIGDRKLTGISVSTIYDYETDPKVTLNFKTTESGPSGGLMLTLAIYNQLVEEDITKGQKIVGTGTIEEDGSIGEIGGVKHKLKGAVDSQADVFLVPSGDNYQEAKQEQEKHHYHITIKEVKTFDDALTILKNLK